MTKAALEARLLALIDELLPASLANEEVASAVSFLMTGTAALRAGLISHAAGDAWRSFDRLKNSGIEASHWANRFLWVWSRAVARDDPLCRQFTDLWFRLLLTRAETDAVMRRAKGVADESRRLRARTPG